MTKYILLAALILSGCNQVKNTTEGKSVDQTTEPSTGLRIDSAIAENLISNISDIEGWDSIDTEQPSKPIGAYVIKMTMVRFIGDIQRIGGTATIDVSADRRVQKIVLQRGYGIYCNNFADAPSQIGQLISALEPNISKPDLEAGARALSTAFIPDGHAIVDVGQNRFSAEGGCINKIEITPI